VSRKDTVRDATGRTKDRLAPHAAHVRAVTVHYAGDAKDRVGPRLEHALAVAKDKGVEAGHRVGPALGTARDKAAEVTRERVVPALEQARDAMAPKVEHAVDTARHRIDRDITPRVQHAVETARTSAAPVLDEARLRRDATMHALRGEVTAQEINKLAKKKVRRRRMRRFAAITALLGGAAAGWSWWRRRNTDPEWLTDEPDLAPAFPSRAATKDGTVERDLGMVGKSTPPVDKVDGTSLTQSVPAIDPQGVVADEVATEKPADEFRSGSTSKPKKPRNNNQ
jgi:hypothetical protein